MSSAKLNAMDCSNNLAVGSKIKTVYSNSLSLHPGRWLLAPPTTELLYLAAEYSGEHACKKKRLL